MVLLGGPAQQLPAERGRLIISGSGYISEFGLRGMIRLNTDFRTQHIQTNNGGIG